MAVAPGAGARCPAGCAMAAHLLPCHPTACYPAPPPQSSTYDAAVDKMGWPTQYEQLVEEKRAINGVTCPLCGAQHLSVEWDSSDLRWVLLSWLWPAACGGGCGRWGAGCRVPVGCW